MLEVICTSGKIGGNSKFVRSMVSMYFERLWKSDTFFKAKLAILLKSLNSILWLGKIPYTTTNESETTLVTVDMVTTTFRPTTSAMTITKTTTIDSTNTNYSTGNITTANTSSASKTTTTYSTTTTTMTPPSMMSMCYNI